MDTFTNTDSIRVGNSTADVGVGSSTTDIGVGNSTADISAPTVSEMDSVNSAFSSLFLFLIVIFIICFFIYIFLKKAKTESHQEGKFRLDNPEYNTEKLNLTQKMIKGFKERPIFSFYIATLLFFSSLSVLGFKWVGVILGLIALKVFIDYPQYKQQKELKFFEETRIDFDSIILTHDERIVFSELFKQYRQDIISDHKEIIRKRDGQGSINEKLDNLDVNNDLEITEED